MYVITLVHTPEQCLAREEFGDEAKRWIAGMDDLAKERGVEIHGAYACPSEHTFYFILEADDLGDISAFFSGIMLTHHTGHVSPVMPLRASADLLIR